MAQHMSQAMYFDLDGQLHEIKRQLRQPSGYPFDPERLRLALQEIIEGKFMTAAHAGANQSYPVVVDYAMSLADMIVAGRYDWTNSDITAKNFPIKGEEQAEVTVELVHFDRYVESKEVLKEFENMGLRAATLEELLAFGAKYPDVQREFPIIALGSVLHDRHGDRDVPVLWGGSDRRDLYLRWFGDGWYEDDRFASVRK